MPGAGHCNRMWVEKYTFLIILHLGSRKAEAVSGSHLSCQKKNREHDLPNLFQGFGGYCTVHLNSRAKGLSQGSQRASLPHVQWLTEPQQHLDLCNKDATGITTKSIALLQHSHIYPAFSEQLFTPTCCWTWAPNPRLLLEWVSNGVNSLFRRKPTSERKVGWSF